MSNNRHAPDISQNVPQTFYRKSPFHIHTCPRDLAPGSRAEAAVADAAEAL